MRQSESQTADIALTPNATPPRRAPAWLMSLGLHIMGLIVLSLVFHRANTDLPDEPPRAAGIVLAEHSEDVAYFTATEQHSEAALDAANASQSSASGADSAFPTAEQAADSNENALNSPELPGLEATTAASDGLLQDVIRSDGGRGVIPSSITDEDILANDPLLNAPARPALGPPATMKIFGTTAVGRSFVLLIDRSKSMGGEGLGAIEAARQELSRAMEALTPAQRVQIVAYNQRLSTNDSQLIPATDENKKLADKFIGGIVAHGQTEHRMAILAVLRNKPEVIYVFTDGGEPALTQSDLRIITLRADGKTVIHCVQFGYGPLQEDDSFLKKLARLNGGSFAYVDMSQVRLRNFK